MVVQQQPAEFERDQLADPTAADSSSAWGHLQQMFSRDAELASFVPYTAATSATFLVSHFPVRPHYRSLAGSSRSGGSTSGTDGVPVFVPPTGGTGSTPAAGAPGGPSAAQMQTYLFHAQTAFQHITTHWKWGVAYYLVLAAFIAPMVLPLLGVLFFLGSWLYEGHVNKGGIQHWPAVPAVAVLWLAWLLAVVALGSRAWKVADNPDQSASDWHFGLDVAVLDGSVWQPLRSVPFSVALDGDDGQRVRSSSAAALALGLLGVFSGFATAVAATMHMYDADRQPQLVGTLATTTAGLWFLMLLTYGTGFPHYVGGRYFEFGYSFWIMLASTCIFILPLLTFLAYLVFRRLRKMSAEERMLCLPLSCTLLALALTLAALGSDQWVQNGQVCPLLATLKQNQHCEEHLGLLRGRLNGEWLAFRALAVASSSGLIRAGLVALSMLLCGLVIQLFVAGMGLLHASGRREGCGGRGQMPLLATALSLSAALIQALGAAGYAALLPFDALPSGYVLAHSWRVAVAASVFSLLATGCFGFLARPPEPGETNILAAAVGQHAGIAK